MQATSRKPQTSALFLCLAGVALVLSACDDNRHLVGEEGNGKIGSTGTGGAAGTGGASAPDGGIAGGSGSGGMVVQPAGPRPLVISAREAVRRLIVVLWNQPTDATLIAEADSGTIQTSEDIRKLALRMLDDPRARAGVGGFYRWWLKLDTLAAVTKDATQFPQFTTELKADMATETETLGVHVTLDVDGTMETLYTTPFSFLTERLAAVYGVPGVTGTAHRKVALDPAVRAGLVTQPSLLATNSLATRTSPTLRGKFLLDQMLCIGVPPPPANVPSLPPTMTTGTTRENLAAHTTNPSCAACHQLIDPPGFALEGLDPIGRVRTTDNGRPVDTTAQLSAAGLNGAVTGARGLAQKLAAAPEAAQCLSKQWLSFALGRDLFTPADQAAATAVYNLFASSGLNLRQLIAAAMQSDAFLARDSLR